MARYAAIWEYVTRITPALSCGLLALLLLDSFVISPFGVEEDGSKHGNTTTLQRFLCIQSLFLHILSILFPLRTLFALDNVIRGIKQGQLRTIQKGIWPSQEAVRFTIIIPAYKEDIETLQRTLSVLSSHSRARHMYHIYLAFEEREKDATAKAQTLMSSFEYWFVDMSFTLHPQGIPNEVPGKSSNESWAARQICRDYSTDTRHDVIITTMDSDTHLSALYFDQILDLHSSASVEARSNTIYMPPLVFDRNLHRVPVLVRTADVLWACAGISSMYSRSSVCIPTSVYSLPLTLVERVGGWDADASAIGEDMHMYLKCFFHLKGNLIAKAVYAAASQCSVGSESRGFGGYVRGMLARYEQAVRHMWGALDTGYALRKAFGMVAWPHFIRSSNKSLDKCDEKCCDLTEDTHPQCIHITKALVVFLRLFEAHQLPIQLGIMVVTSAAFMFVCPNFLIPPMLNTVLSICKLCRTISFILMLGVFYRYEHYHRLCSGLRKEEMRAAGLLNGTIEEDDFSPNVFQRFGILEALLFPLGGFVFGIFPALQAIVMHIFTDRLVYKVSLKPQLLRRKLEINGMAEDGGHGLREMRES